MSSRALSTWAAAKPLTASVMAARRMRAAQMRPVGLAAARAAAERKRLVRPQARHLAVCCVVMLRPYTHWCRYVKRCRLTGMDDSAIERELADAQADIVEAREATARRRKAVMLAREHGWSKYRIAAVLGVKGPTVDSIIASAEREAGE
jgi:hypothetical protein